MINKATIYTRLLLCLTLSFGVHAGLVYVGWLKAPLQLAVNNPVEVSFLPVVEVTRPAAETLTAETTEPVREPLPQPRQRVMQKAEQAPGVEREKVLMATPPAPEPEVVAPVETLVGDGSPVPQLQAAEQTVAATAVVPITQTPGAVPVATASAPVLIEAVPRYRSNPPPEYPYFARQRDWEGLVLLLVDVSADGSVEDLAVEQSSGHKILDRAATRTVARWRFEPATRAGIPVTSQVIIPVNFYLE